MTAKIEQMLEQARLARRDGDPRGALMEYDQAARLAREANADGPLVHALRHVAELALELGQRDRAIGAGQEAVQVVREQPDAPPLEHANALRIAALALDQSDRRDDALPMWREALALYDTVGVQSGVAECEARIQG